MLEMEVKCKCDKNCINSFHKRAQWPFCGIIGHPPIERSAYAYVFWQHRRIEILSVLVWGCVRRHRTEIKAEHFERHAKGRC